MKEDATDAEQYIQVMIVARILKNFIYGFSFMETGNAMILLQDIIGKNGKANTSAKNAHPTSSAS